MMIRFAPSLHGVQFPQFDLNSTHYPDVTIQEIFEQFLNLDTPPPGTTLTTRVARIERPVGMAYPLGSAKKLSELPVGLVPLTVVLDIQYS